MSGFFGNLLSRSRGTADVVRPRLASLFEPGEPRSSHLAAEPSADAEQDLDDTSVAEGRTNTASPFAASFVPHGLTQSHAGLDPASRREQVGGDIDTRDDTHADAAAWSAPRAHGGDGSDAAGEAHALAGSLRPTFARANGGAARNRRSRFDRADHADRADRTAEAAAAAAFGALHGGGDLTSTPPAMSASAMRAALAQALGTRAARGATRGSAGSSGSHGAAGAWDSSLASGTMPTAALIAAARPPSAVSPMPVSSPFSRLHSEASASRPRTGAGASEPIIEITIGRIEVRAAIERGSDRKAAATPSPVMSLDEYLQTRARGGSR